MEVIFNEEAFGYDDEFDALLHYGTKHHSGRYPWGSGENPYQHPYESVTHFYNRYNELKRQGLTESQIAEQMGIGYSDGEYSFSTTELRAYYSVAKDEVRMLKVSQAKQLRDEGLSTTEIGRRMNVNESTVRSWFDEEREAKMYASKQTAEIIKKYVDEHGAADVGAQVERDLGVSREKLEQALIILDAEGYSVQGFGVPQPTNPGKQTNMKVVFPPGTKFGAGYKLEDIGHPITAPDDYISLDNGKTFQPTYHYPESIDASRIFVRYGEDGGRDRDGVIELRRGVDDISLGNANYAQARILVNGTNYMKGMAIYSDDIPDGYDIIYNSNKPRGSDFDTVFKKIKDDPENPFGANIKLGTGQTWYIDKNGNKQLSVVNKLKESGDWDEQQVNLASQFLAKQSESLMSSQLNLAYKQSLDEYNDLCSLTNPVLKRKMLYDFAEDCDSKAGHLKAAALPRQSTKVILPVPDLKDDEIYAPTYKDGEKLALVRFPHAGPFEIPIVRVNNKNPKGEAVVGKNSIDAVGINIAVAAKLSGADFDGDTVVVIPCDKIKIESYDLPGMKGFDPSESYSYPQKMLDNAHFVNNVTKLRKEGKDDNYISEKLLGDKNADLKGAIREANKNKASLMKEESKGKEMGIVSNLITDMYIQGAPVEEIERAAKHSMVVVDAVKHELNYKQSYIDNGIAELQDRYQGHYDEAGKWRHGASTLLSKANADIQVLKTKGNPNVNPVTGEKTFDAISYKDPKTGKIVNKPDKHVVEEYVDKKGKTQVRTVRSTWMNEAKDANELNSGSPVEDIYANYANQMKALANSARKESMATPKLEYSTTAKKTFEQEVSSLNAKLNNAAKNAPRERRALTIAKAEAKKRIDLLPKGANGKPDKKDVAKINQQELQKARLKAGSNSRDNKILITDTEWEAIQSGALSDSKVSEIFKYADSDDLRKRASTRAPRELPTHYLNKMKSMEAAGYTIGDIANSLGVSPATVNKYLGN